MELVCVPCRWRWLDSAFLWGWVGVVGWVVFDD
jgi:hypothetical protein